MRVDEDNYGVLRRAEDMLGTDFEINLTNDDDITGFVNEDVFEIIDKLCDEIIRLRGDNNE